jgi:energy-coupling factor transport system ATP-binding protein
MHPTPFFEAREISFRFPSIDEKLGRNALQGLSLALENGSLSLLLGAADAGKTTFSRIVAGLVPRFTGGRLAGSMSLDGRDILALPPYELMEKIGLVSQSSDEQIFLTRCDAEVAFALESLGVPAPLMREKVAESLRTMGLEGFEGRNPSTLSGGEKKRLLLACLHAIQPSLWILDESLAELDLAWKTRVISLLSGSDATVLIMDSRWQEGLARSATGFALLSNGRVSASAVAPDDAVFYGAMVEAGIVQSDAPRKTTSLQRKPFISARNLRFRFPGPDGFALIVDSLDLSEGEMCCLLGRNGSGKSTLGRILCGLQRPDEGTLTLASDGQAQGDMLCSRVGYLFQNPDHQIYLPTVREELSLGLSRRGIGQPEIERRVRDAARQFVLPDLAEPPALMSFGARRRLQAATYYLLARRLLILDEVDSGLSYRELESLIEALRSGGAGIVLITHDVRFARSVADRILVMDKGAMIADVGHADFRSLDSLAPETFLP